jgi:hypothetical protein
VRIKINTLTAKLAHALPQTMKGRRGDTSWRRTTFRGDIEVEKLWISISTSAAEEGWESVQSRNAMKTHSVMGCADKRQFREPSCGVWGVLLAGACVFGNRILTSAIMRKL